MLVGRTHIAVEAADADRRGSLAVQRFNGSSINKYPFAPESASDFVGILYSFLEIVLVVPFMFLVVAFGMDH